MKDDTSALTHDVALRCPPDSAFATYVERVGEWWPPTYTANPETLEAVAIEPRVGGRVYATHTDLGEHDWGVVTGFEPARRLAHTFTLAQDPAHPSEVSVEFRPAADGGCVASLEHGGWSGANAAARVKFGDWPVILERFAALADA